MKDRLLALLRIALGAVFVYSAATKALDMAALAEAVSNYRMLPGILIPFFAVAVVGMEFVAGLALVLGVATRAAVFWVALMLIAFVIALSQALLRGIDLSCGCFGAGDTEHISWSTVGRDLLYLAMSLPVARYGAGRLLPRRAAAARRLAVQASSCDQACAPDHSI